MEQKTKKKISRLILAPAIVIISGVVGYNIGLNKEKDEKKGKDRRQKKRRNEK